MQLDAERRMTRARRAIRRTGGGGGDLPAGDGGYDPLDQKINKTLAISKRLCYNISIESAHSEKRIARSA